LFEALWWKTSEPEEGETEPAVEKAPDDPEKSQAKKRRHNVGVVDLLSLYRSRLQKIKQNGRNSSILVGNFEFGLKLADISRKCIERRRRYDGTGPCRRGEEFAKYLTARPEHRTVAFEFEFEFEFAQLSTRRLIERCAGKNSRKPEYSCREKRRYLASEPYMSSRRKVIAG
jgi:hypothetical protein